MNSMSELCLTLIEKTEKELEDLKREVIQKEIKPLKKKRKDFRKLYERIVKSDWYINAYKDKSVGEIIEIKD